VESVYLLLFPLSSRKKATNTPRRRISCCPSHNTHPSSNSLGIKAVALSRQVLFMLLPVAQLLHPSSNTLGIKAESPFSSDIIHAATRRTIVTYIIKHIGHQRRKPFLVTFCHPQHAAARRTFYIRSQTHCASKQKALPFLVRFCHAQLIILMFDLSRRPVETRKGREEKKGRMVLAI
jgi:hypothetical protein